MFPCELVGARLRDANLFDIIATLATLGLLGGDPRRVIVSLACAGLVAARQGVIAQFFQHDQREVVLAECVLER